MTGVALDPDFDWSDIVFADCHDIPGVNHAPPFPADQPALTHGICRHVGEPVLLLAAETRSRALMARQRIELHERPIAAVTDLNAALAAVDAATDADESLIHCQRRLDKGEGAGCVSRALDADPAAILVEGCYRTGAQEHIYLEPQGVLAQPWGKDWIEVRGSLQCPFFVAEALAGVLALTMDRVRVIQCPTGGGFGGKED